MSLSLYSIYCIYIYIYPPVGNLVHQNSQPGKEKQDAQDAQGLDSPSRAPNGSAISTWVAVVRCPSVRLQFRPDTARAKVHAHLRGLFTAPNELQKTGVWRVGLVWRSHYLMEDASNAFTLYRRSISIHVTLKNTA